MVWFSPRKRQREEEIEAQEKAKREREWQKNFEVNFHGGQGFLFQSKKTSQHRTMVLRAFPGLTGVDMAMGRDMWGRAEALEHESVLAQPHVSSVALLRAVRTPEWWVV